MNGLNKNGRSKINYEALKQFDEPGKQLAYNTLRKIFKEPEYSYNIVEKYQFGDIEILKRLTNKLTIVETEFRTGWQHKNNMQCKFPDVNITLKNNVEELQKSGAEGFCISLSMDDLEKPFASEFYISKLSDLKKQFTDVSPNYRNQNEKFFKLLHHQVVKWVYDFELEIYVNQNEYKPRFYNMETDDDYYN
jgi:hypothetical protein